MNNIKQRILMATVVFIISLLFSYLFDGKINWIIAFGVTSGFLFGSLVIDFWQKDAEKQQENLC